jgi:transposase
MPAGRPLTLPSSIHDYDFEKLAKQERHARTRMRLIAFAHLKKGKRIREAAEAVGVHETTIGGWIRNFKKEGIEGLKEKEGRGAKRKIAEAQSEAFREAVLQLQADKKGGRIRGQDVLTLMREKLGIECHLDTAYETLKRADLVWITSRSKHPKADEEQQEAFKKTL